MQQSMISRKAATSTILKRISDALHNDSSPLKVKNKENSPERLRQVNSNYKEENPFQIQIDTGEFKLDSKKDQEYYMGKLGEC